MQGAIIPKLFVKTEWSFKATPDGGSEIDSGAALKTVVRVIDDLLAASNKIDGEIEYVASCALWHSLVGVDEGGKPTTKVLGWADTRSREFGAVLRKGFDERTIHNRTGASFHSSFWPAKLLWLRKQFPDVFARTARWLSLSDFIAMKLSDGPTTSVSMASGTGVFDIRKCDWDDELLRFLKIPRSKVPAIPAHDGDGFQLNRRFAKRWPRLQNSKWFPAIADGAANNIGAGCVTKERAALMVGTSGAMRVAYEGKPPAKIPDGLWCYRIDRRRVIIGGALSDGGGLYQWLRENLRLDPRAEAEVAKRPPGAHGLVFLPFLAGERSTGYNEDATGAVLGLRSSTDNTDMLRAALESVAFRFAEIFDRLNVVCKIRGIVASGGAIEESPVWTQIISDVLGRDITVSDASEASMRGTVLLALETTGKIKLLDKVSTKKGKQFQSDGSRRAAYIAARKRHNETYKLLIDREK